MRPSWCNLKKKYKSVSIPVPTIFHLSFRFRSSHHFTLLCNGTFSGSAINVLIADSKEMTAVWQSTKNYIHFACANIKYSCIPRPCASTSCKAACSALAIHSSQWKSNAKKAKCIVQRFCHPLTYPSDVSLIYYKYCITAINLHCITLKAKKSIIFVALLCLSSSALFIVLLWILHTIHSTPNSLQ